MKTTIVVYSSFATSIASGIVALSLLSYRVILCSLFAVSMVAFLIGVVFLFARWEEI